MVNIGNDSNNKNVTIKIAKIIAHWALCLAKCFSRARFEWIKCLYVYVYVCVCSQWITYRCYCYINTWRDVRIALISYRLTMVMYGVDLIAGWLSFWHGQKAITCRRMLFEIFGRLVHIIIIIIIIESNIATDMAPHTAWTHPNRYFRHFVYITAYTCLYMYYMYIHDNRSFQTVNEKE